MGNCSTPATRDSAEIQDDGNGGGEGPAMKAFCRSCNNTGTDFLGNRCACEHGAKHSVNKPIFMDMVHSNNAARVRLWMRLKGLDDTFTRKVLTYADLVSQEFKKVNPFGKVPAFITDQGTLIFESHVIMQYLEDKMTKGVSLVLQDPEERAFVNLLVRIHDLYISSPNCTQPNFSHTQGCMYLGPHASSQTPAERAMDRPTRAAKVAEIWTQLNWLEQHVKSPYMAGERLTHADLTWFPTATFMEFMLPRVFAWPEVFRETETFPKLTAWFTHLTEQDIFKSVHGEIWDFWVQKEQDGQFEPIKEEAMDKSFKW
eukprot:CAMPEP_0179212006 /NCGR_PEP_ID=MMETSP0797-20121207/828_1 /TAXON_ID=47934 /ORGANISM="Dinophysis acuminata, Strain DAEP01" /LENGTH=314 /DNA_ID=CAMNT_0020917495 /DNA_START=17 /DNA_END=957 /DNA_ORIENTATION=-